MLLITAVYRGLNQIKALKPAGSWSTAFPPTSSFIIILISNSDAGSNLPLSIKHTQAHTHTHTHTHFVVATKYIIAVLIASSPVYGFHHMKLYETNAITIYYCLCADTWFGCQASPSRAETWLYSQPPLSLSLRACLRQYHRLPGNQTASPWHGVLPERHGCVGGGRQPRSSTVNAAFLTAGRCLYCSRPTCRNMDDRGCLHGQLS